MLVKLTFDNIFCYIDENYTIYSARRKILKPWINKNDGITYYKLCYNGEKTTVSLTSIIKRLEEKNGKIN